VIRVLALDVDGVLTDGSVVLDEDGRERKALYYRDIDAVFAARRRGLVVALVTGEDSPIVDTIARRLEVEHVYRGEKDKEAVLPRLAAELGVGLDEVCFVGDSARDAPAFPLVGLGLAPADAHESARALAHRVLAAPGGRGAVAEACELLLDSGE
jgi:YrbI family 3-deoxy-D-manno-octulosonate 8-phosphate phosphatase